MRAFGQQETFANFLDLPKNAVMSGWSVGDS